MTGTLPVPVLGELLALLLPGLALFGSELEGVGWWRSAERLALFPLPVVAGGPFVPLISEWELRGGDTEVLGGVPDAEAYSLCAA